MGKMSLPLIIPADVGDAALSYPASFWLLHASLLLALSFSNLSAGASAHLSLALPLPFYSPTSLTPYTPMPPKTCVSSLCLPFK